MSTSVVFSAFAGALFGGAIAYLSLNGRSFLLKLVIGVGSCLFINTTLFVGLMSLNPSCTYPWMLTNLTFSDDFTCLFAAGYAVMMIQEGILRPRKGNRPPDNGTNRDANPRIPPSGNELPLVETGDSGLVGESGPRYGGSGRRRLPQSASAHSTAGEVTRMRRPGLNDGLRSLPGDDQPTYDDARFDPDPATRVIMAVRRGS